MERAVERGIRRANGEELPDDSCMACAGCLIVLPLLLFIIWVIIKSN
ncbi:hypothetical protein OG765_05115 [Streptomyces sp. NBC_00555]|nr:hypothetical protein [Streptomyces sp. NBC_00555]MCX5010370.1 hypothetical protein [Streptomyces sp. NBC_00555]